MPTERNQILPNILCDSTQIQVQKCKLTYSHRKQTSGCFGRRWWDGGECLHRDTHIILWVMDVFTLLIMVMVSQVFTYVMSHQIIPTKYVQPIVSIIYSKSVKKKTKKPNRMQAFRLYFRKDCKIFQIKMDLKISHLRI